MSPCLISRYGINGPTYAAFDVGDSRSTKTWSPTRSVLTMDSDGISKACTMNVRMNNPDTSTEAIPAIDSGRLSFFFSGFFSLLLSNKRGFLLEMD